MHLTKRNLLEESGVSGSLRYSLVEHLAKTLGGRSWSSLPLGMFTACFDASGDDHSQILLVVAGFVAEANAWLDWEERWLVRLKKDQLALFHNKERLSDADKQRRLIEDLARITREHVAYKFGVIVKNEDVTNVLTKVQRDKWHIEAYSIAGRTIAKEARLWSASWGGRIPELVFERGDKGHGKLRRLLARDGYHDPIFRPKRRFTERKSGIVHEPFVPLQAADLLAGQIFAVGRTVLRPDFAPSGWARIDDNLDKIPGEFGIIEPPRYQLILQGYEEQNNPIMKPLVRIKLT